MQTNVDVRWIIQINGHHLQLLRHCFGFFSADRVGFRRAFQSVQRFQCAYCLNTFLECFVPHLCLRSSAAFFSRTLSQSLASRLPNQLLAAVAYFVPWSPTNSFRCNRTSDSSESIRDTVIESSQTGKFSRYGETDGFQEAA